MGTYKKGNKHSFLREEKSYIYCRQGAFQRTLTGERITDWLVSGLIGLDLTKQENILLFVYTEPT